MEIGAFSMQKEGTKWEKEKLFVISANLGDCLSHI